MIVIRPCPTTESVGEEAKNNLHLSQLKNELTNSTNAAARKIAQMVITGEVGCGSSTGTPEAVAAAVFIRCGRLPNPANSGNGILFEKLCESDRVAVGINSRSSH